MGKAAVNCGDERMIEGYICRSKRSDEIIIGEGSKLLDFLSSLEPVNRSISQS